MYTIIGDPHAKPDNLDKINTLFDMVEDLGNPAIWLGDTLDTKELIRGKALNTIYRRLKVSKLEHIFLIGNHCWFSLECKEHSLEALKELPNVTIIDKPATLKLGTVPCRFYPYMHDVEVLRSDLEKLTDKPIFGHFEISTFDFGNGHIAESGLSPEDFTKFRRVISGHFHKYQNEGSITFLGTPFSHSFGESNQLKYLGLYDPKKDTLELIETPFPRHLTFEVDCSKQKVLQKNDTDIVRVILTGTQEEIDRFQKLEGVKYIERPTTAAADAIVSETDSPEVQFQKWAQEIKGYSPEIVAMGLEVLQDV